MCIGNIIDTQNHRYTHTVYIFTEIRDVSYFIDYGHARENISLLAVEIKDKHVQDVASTTICFTCFCQYEL